MIRAAAVKGRFYPETLRDVKGMIETWKQQRNSSPQIVTKPVAAIVPHAGYIFSGMTAWYALNNLHLSEKKRVVIIGPSHRVYLSGLSICLSESYETVEANQPVDVNYSQNLAKKFHLIEVEEAHYEHSTEVQVPLIQQLAPEIPLVEIIYGSATALELEKVITYLLNDSENALIITSDLSHYYSEEVALRLDKACIEGIEDFNISRLQECEACGRTGIEALLRAAQKKSLSSEIVDYRTSGDSVYGNKEQVVGYLSALIG